MKKDQDLFLSILDGHKEIIYKIANSYCKVVSDRDDLIQEIIIQLWLSLDKYDNQFKLSTWLYRIALNTSISFYRKNKNRREKTVGLSFIIEKSIIDDDQSLEHNDFVLLQQYIRELKEIDKALMLLYLDGLSYKEIAEVINISPTNVSTKIARIKKYLKKKFQTIKTEIHGG